MRSESDLVHGMRYDEWLSLPQSERDFILEEEKSNDSVTDGVCVVVTLSLMCVFLFVVLPLVMGA